MALWPRDRHRMPHRRAAWEHPVTVRLAVDADAAALRRLAGRDSRPLPPGPHLVAERDGRIDAAVSLATGGVIADPFRRTAEIVDLLRCHAGRAGASAPQPAEPAPPRLRPQPAT